MRAVGQVYEIDIDDTVPVNLNANGNFTFVMAAGAGGVIWGPLIEKAYAKLVGNYDSIANGGSATEFIRAVAGLPGFAFITNTTTNAISLITTALQ